MRINVASASSVPVNLYRSVVIYIVGVSERTGLVGAFHFMDTGEH